MGSLLSRHFRGEICGFSQFLGVFFPSPQIWEGLTLRFRRVVALDFVGFGFSDKPVSIGAGGTRSPSHPKSLPKKRTLKKRTGCFKGGGARSFLVSPNLVFWGASKALLGPFGVLPTQDAPTARRSLP